MTSSPTWTAPHERHTDALLRAIGKRIRLARLIREMTQAELADAAGISRSFVSLIEHGAKGIDVVRLYRIAAALDLSLTELLDDKRQAAS